ncbi:MAG: DUF1553 domain-containing protein [Phycisphaerales bacterium]|nr:DUF1553 domain-containing protein [Phycisphaerales bacterium]
MKHAHRVAGLSLSLAIAGLLFAALGLSARPTSDADPASRTPIPTKIDFNRDVRPIISANCFACHGPDEKTRDSGLRLDQPEGILATLKTGNIAVVPGDLAKSALYHRITTTDAKDIMPPVKSNKTLTARQIEILKRWIEQGGQYDKHWALIPPVKPQPPQATESTWPRNPIDNFILAKLDEAGLKHGEEADRRTLIRRLSLDLTGLPPTLDEIKTFLGDQSPDAYEKLVDRLLASPRYGERMATDWLDAARFGDSNGYHIDNERYMWKWREWVIDAFNTNIPFDRFTVEQLAGDMLPPAPTAAQTQNQQLASGFNRNHMINFEGGAIPEEYLHNYLVDRVNTTSTVWLGLTMSCAQCHDHKYDPISHEDYYKFYAIFNNIPEKGLDGNTGNSEPFIKLPTPDESARLEELLARSKSLSEQLDGPMPEADAAQSTWEAEIAKGDASSWTIAEPISAVSTAGSVLTIQPDKSLLATGTAPEKEDYDLLCLVPGGTDGSVSAIRLEVLRDPTLPEMGPGRAFNGNIVLGEVQVDAFPVNDPAATRKIPLVNAFADYSQDKFPVSQAIDGKPDTGWASGSHIMRGDREIIFVFDKPVTAGPGTLLRVRLSFQTQFAKHAIGKFRLSLLTDATRHASMAPSDLSGWHSVGPFPTEKSVAAALAQQFGPEKDVDLNATFLDGALKWEKRDDLIDGQVNMLPSVDYQTMFFTRTITTSVPRRITLSLGSDDAIRVWLDGAKVHEAGLEGRAPAPNQDTLTLDIPAGEHRLLFQVINFTGGFAIYFNRTADDGMPAPLDIAKLIAIPADKREDAQKTQIRDFFRAARSPEWRNLKKDRDAVLAEHKQYDSMLPTAMVMKEMDAPRKTHIHTRGEYDLLGAEVTPGVPHALPPLPADQPANRLTLARWLVDGDNPLTARVFVNRLWQNLYGTGLVKTSEDFGMQGQWPSHPELLDWLAVDFVENNWDIKHAIRQIVTSATYRQAARATPKALEDDPEDRLLSYHPRIRLSAEGIRDNALYISGLLVEKVGGPSVRPYHPAGLWEEMSLDPTGATFSGQVYKQDTGESLYRRTMYTYRKRSVPFPTLQIFDASNRELCSVRRPRTNTPLQALVVLNETGFVESARRFAQRIITSTSAGTDADTIALAFELATAQAPSNEQSQILLDLLHEQRAVYAADTAEADKLMAVGESPRDPSIPAHEHAAWTIVCSAILNMDDTLVKD